MSHSPTITKYVETLTAPPPPYPSADERYPGIVATLNPPTSPPQTLGRWLQSLGRKIKALCRTKKENEEHELHLL
ncbi:hypothetical protein C8R46DRAFT_1208102 [Mycena filopes]|nr:hypothetical protein C8R46DRAFT_1208102 [Mycena filopes]